MKRERRVLLLMPEYVWGGAETQFRYLLDYAEECKWNIDVIVEHRFKKEDLCLEEVVSKAQNVHFYELDGCNRDVEIFGKIINHILKNILYKKYTVCLIYYMPDLAIAPYMRTLGMRVIYSERIDAAGINDSRYLQNCLRFCNQILANSVYGQKQLEQLVRRRVKLISNGKPVVPMFPIQRKSKISRVLVPARISPDKNQMLMLHYLKNYPDYDGKVIFAGVTGHKSYKRKLQQFIRKNNLQEKVEFLGYVEDLAEEYKKADLVALPSFAEGTPNVVLEAFLYGRPVIVSDIVPQQDIVMDYRLRFGIKNPEEIQACIKYIEEMTEETYRQLLRKNREYVLRNYSIKMMVKNFENILFKK